MTLTNEVTGERDQWFYTGGLHEYLAEQLGKGEWLPPETFYGKRDIDGGSLDWAFAWVLDGERRVAESYVNLIPTTEGGTHVNGLRVGASDAVREFCEFRNLVPRGLKLTPEDVWDGVSFVLSMKMREPQFAGQTKEKLSSRESAGIVQGVIKDSVRAVAQSASGPGRENRHGGDRQGAAARQGQPEDRAQAHRVGRGSAGQARRLREPGPGTRRAVPGRGRFGRRLRQAGARPRHAGDHAPARQDSEHLGVRFERGAAIAGSAQHQHRHRRRSRLRPILSGLRYHKICILADADSDGQHIATLLCALFLRHYRPLVAAGHVYVCMPPLFRIDAGKEVIYALDEAERERALKRIAEQNSRTKVVVTRFKGLGEMSATQLRETTMAPQTRRLVQLTIDAKDNPDQLLDMLLAKKRAGDRREWLESKGNLARV